MPQNDRNAEMVGLLETDFVGRNEPNYAWRAACSQILALPGLRGFWPMSAFSSGGNAFDQSGNSRTLTYNGNPVYGYDGLAPYIELDGAGDYLNRADEAGLDISGAETYVNTPGLTCGCWMYPTDAASAQGVITKDNGIAPTRSFGLQIFGSVVNDPVRFFISDDGTNINQATLDGYTTSIWQFVAGRFNDADVGEELSVWINDTKGTAATARNSIFNSASNFSIGSRSGGGFLFTGKISLAFLCATALSDTIIQALFENQRAMFNV